MGRDLINILPTFCDDQISTHLENMISLYSRAFKILDLDNHHILLVKLDKYLYDIPIVSRLPFKSSVACNIFNFCIIKARDLLSSYGDCEYLFRSEVGSTQNYYYHIGT